MHGRNCNIEICIHPLTRFRASEQSLHLWPESNSTLLSQKNMINVRCVLWSVHQDTSVCLADISLTKRVVHRFGYRQVRATPPLFFHSHDVNFNSPD